MANPTSAVQSFITPSNADHKIQRGLESTVQDYYPNEMLGVDSSGWDTKCDDTQSLQFDGLVADSVKISVLTGDAAGARFATVERPQFFSMFIASANAATDIGKAVYALYSNQVQYSSGNFTNLVGFVYAVLDATHVLIKPVGFGVAVGSGASPLLAAITASTTTLPITGQVGSGAGAGGTVTVTAGQGGPTGIGGVSSMVGGAGGTSSGAGGVSAIIGGAGTASNSAGGAAQATGGAGHGSSAGGAFTAAGGVGGATGAGGAASVTGGAGGATSGTGGAATVVGGAGAGTNAIGGAAGVTGGAGAGTQAGGAASLIGGAGGLTGAGGAVTITSGAGGGTSGLPGAINISVGASTSGAGAAITITAGSGGAGTDAGGNVNLVGGAAFSTGVPGEVQVNGSSHLIPVQVALTATDASRAVFIATRACRFKAISYMHTTGSSSGTLTVEKLTGTTAAGSGTALLTGTMDLSTTTVANTVITGTPIATVASLTLAVGDRLSVKIGGSMTGLVGAIATLMVAPA